MSKIKYIKIISLLLILSFSLFFFLKINPIRLYVSDITPQILKDIKDVILNNSEYQNSKKNKNFLYNVVFLPETSYQKMNLEIKDFNIKDNLSNQIANSFYIDLYDNNILLVTFDGNIFVNTDNNFDYSYFNLKKINSNLKNKEPNISKVLDILIDQKNLYVSLMLDPEINECQYFKILKTNLDLDNIVFEDFFVSNECGDYIQAGRMQPYVYNNKSGILVSTADIIADLPNSKSQSLDSIFGKILFIEKDTKELIIYSKGHRNTQGLTLFKDIILATEHGPRGGDEINKIIYGGNYGWPISSYGTPYDQKVENKFKYDHEKFNFIEPIYAFVPSIGISEIIPVPEGFIKQEGISNLFFVTSLNGKSIFLIKFDNKYEKVIFAEKILIGERIRDIKYLKSKNSFLLSLETSERLGILKNID